MLTVPCYEKEQLHLDLFLFSYYTGGMANVDVCNLTWDLVQEDRIVYERIKFPKTAKPELLSKAKAIMNKYRGQSYGNYVFPVLLINTRPLPRRLHVSSKFPHAFHKP